MDNLFLEQNFADAVYAKFLKERYGINSCRELDLEDLRLSKEISDWENICDTTAPE